MAKPAVPAIANILNDILDRGYVEISGKDGEGGKPIRIGLGSIERGDRTGLVSAYRSFLNDVSSQGSASAAQQRMRNIHRNLAYRIARLTGREEKDAKAAAIGSSMPSVAAWLLMQRSGMNRLPQVFTNFNRAMGVKAPLGEFAGQQRYRNNKFQSLSGTLLNYLSSPSQLDRLGGMNPGQAAEWITGRGGQGAFNDILNNRKFLNRDGTLNRHGQLMARKRTEQLLDIGQHMKALTGGTIPEAFNRFESLFGRDPIMAVGPQTLNKSLERMRHSAAVSGAGQKDMQNLLVHLARDQGLTKAGVHPSKVLTLAEYGARMMKGGQSGPVAGRGFTPEAYNADVLQNIARADRSPEAKALKSGYAALAQNYGEQRADQIIDRVMRTEHLLKGDPKNTADRIAEQVNQYLSPNRQLRPDNWRKFLASNEARKFDMSGRGMDFLLQNRFNRIKKTREGVLRGGGFSGRDIQQIRQSNRDRLTEQGIYRFLVGRNIDQTRARQLSREAVERWQKRLGDHGISSQASADRILQAQQQLPRYAADVRSRQRQRGLLPQRGRSGGLTGAMGGLLRSSKPKWEDVWEGYKGDTTLTPDQLAQQELKLLKNQPGAKPWEALTNQLPEQVQRAVQ